MPSSDAVNLSQQVTQGVIDTLLPGGRLCPAETIILVDSPAGAGKTYLIESVLEAIRTAPTGEPVKVLLVGQTNAQTVDLAVRVAQRLQGAGLLADGEEVVWLASASAADTYANHRELIDPTIPVRMCSKPADVGDAYVVAGTVDKIAATPGVYAGAAVGVMDEAYQCPIMKSAMTGAAERWVLVGDPGQIAPFSPADLSRWEGRDDDPLVPLPHMIRNATRDGQLTVHQFALPVSWRLPQAAIPLVQNAFYPQLRFRAATVRSERRTSHQDSRSLWWPTVEHALNAGWAHLLLPPGVAAGEGVDDEVADAVAGVVTALFDGRVSIVDDERSVRLGPITPGRVAVGVSHVIQADMIRGRLHQSGIHGVVVDTANRLQGLEFDVTVVWHPLAGMLEADPFHLDAGRMCVLVTRHRHACIVVGRESDLDLADHPPVLDPSGESVSKTVIEAWEAHTLIFDQLAPHRRHAG